MREKSNFVDVNMYGESKRVHTECIDSSTGCQGAKAKLHSVMFYFFSCDSRRPFSLGFTYCQVHQTEFVQSVKNKKQFLLKPNKRVILFFVFFFAFISLGPSVFWSQFLFRCSHETQSLVQHEAEKRSQELSEQTLHVNCNH